MRKAKTRDTGTSLQMRRKVKSKKKQQPLEITKINTLLRTKQTKKSKIYI